MTTRRLMIAVAVVAAVLGGCIGLLRLAERSMLYNETAYLHGNAKLYYELVARIYPDLDKSGVGLPSLRKPGMTEAEILQVRENAGKLARYYEALEEKYVRASARAWLPLASDPPAPTPTRDGTWPPPPRLGVIYATGAVVWPEEEPAAADPSGPRSPSGK